jgi:uridylate kinase
VSEIAYKRVLLKLSGQALDGEDDIIDPIILGRMAEEIGEIQSLGVEFGIVVGAGNIFRGSLGVNLGIDRKTGDHMGMIATVMNALALHDAFKKRGIPSRVLSSIEITGIAEPYVISKAEKHLEKKRIVIMPGGTGHPFFTTDTAASLRAVELDADLLLKATRVDGVYTADPEKDKNAKKIDLIRYIDIIKDDLRIMDLTAVSLCMENNMPITVFNLFNKGSMKKIILGENIGTKIRD